MKHKCQIALLTASIFSYLNLIHSISENDLRFNNLKLCFPTHTKNHYVLDEVPDCSNIFRSDKPVSFEADIYTPSSVIKELKGWACSLQYDDEQKTSYLFSTGTDHIGSGMTRNFDYLYHHQYKKKHINSFEDLCRYWIKNKKDPYFGDLRVDGTESEKESTSWSTNLKHKEWATIFGNYDRVWNPTLIKTSLFYNLVRKKATNILDHSVTCDLKKGTCLSPRYLFVLESRIKNDQEKCSNTKKPIVRKTSALMFKDDNGINSFISIPKMDLVFSGFVKCPQHLLDCYSENKYEVLVCTSNHYMIASNNYKEGLIKFQNKDEDKNSVNSNSAVENVVNMLYETDTSMFIVCKSKYL